MNEKQKCCRLVSKYLFLVHLFLSMLLNKNIEVFFVFHSFLFSNSD